MKYTLLEMVQNILSSLDGDEVNSISDTVEATQVATVVRTCYYDIVSSLELPEHKDLFELTATDANTPVVMSLPSDVTKVEWLRYNNYTADDPHNKFLPVLHLEIDEFLDRAYNLDVSQDYVDTISLTTNGSDTLTLNFRNDAHPKFFTSFNDNTVLFDSYDSDEDAFLQKTKTQAYGLMVPTFTMSDGFTPSLDARQFTLLLNEAKAQAFMEMKQQANPKAERRARRGWINVQRTKDVVTKHPNYIGYGRK